MKFTGQETTFSLLVHHFGLCWSLPTIMLFALGLGLAIIALRGNRNAPEFMTVGCLLLELVSVTLLPQNIMNVTTGGGGAWEEFHAFCKWSLTASYLIPMLAVVVFLVAFALRTGRYCWPPIIGTLGITANYLSLRWIM